MNPYRMDAIRSGAAVAHADAAPHDKRSARRWHVSRRTATRWRNDGPPQVRACAEYLHGCDDPHRVVAYLGTVADAEVRDLSHDALLDAYHAAQRDAVVADCCDRLAPMSTDGWEKCASAAERAAAIHIRKAAILREFVVRQMTREEVSHAA